jgi:hypothetical protein
MEAVMRKLILSLAVLAVLIVPFTVQAEGSVHFASVNVAIWPEYDQPAVLVIYRLALVPDTVLPANLTLRIPAQAQINAVAVVDQTNGLLTTPYERTVNGQWAVLKFTVNTLESQVEYYDTLVKNGTARHVVFEWAGDNPVDVLDMNFLQPVAATDVNITPTPLESAPGQDGLTNHHIQTKNLLAGQKYTLTVDYQRQTDGLSIASQPVQAAATPGPDTSGRVSMTGVLPWVLAGLGAFLIVFGLVSFFAWQRGSREPNARKRHASRLKQEDGETDEAYCHQCGKRAQAGDVFCRTCGARLRKGAPD